MYITNNTIIMKQAQYLDNVKTMETLTERELTRALKDAIIAEEDAIKQYETVADSTDNEKVKAVLNDIANEEKVHVDEIQTLLADILPDEEDFLEEGKSEVEDEIKTAGKGKIDPKEMEMGIEVEKEHSDIYNQLKKMFGEDIPWTLDEFAKKIAKGHFKELKDYYTRLKNMEGSAKNDWNN